MLPLNRYFQAFGDDLSLYDVSVGVDFSCLGGFLNVINSEENIQRLKSDFPRAYRLAHEAVFRIGFTFLSNRDSPTFQYISTYSHFDRNWVSFVIVRDEVTAEKMEFIMMQAISDCHLKMLRHNRR